MICSISGIMMRRTPIRQQVVRRHKLALIIQVNAKEILKSQH